MKYQILITMEENFEGKREKTADSEILFSKGIKAGKRIYYFDVKKDRRSEMYISITESKRVSGSDDSHYVFEKHKIFLYKEEFEKFREAMNEIIDFASKNNAGIAKNDDKTLEKPGNLDFDIEF